MNLYIIRHAISEQRHIFAQTGQSDELRPITNRGAERMKGLLSFIKNNSKEQINNVLQSPLLRSQQTGTLVKEFYPQARYMTTSLLRPSFSFKKLLEEIQQFEPTNNQSPPSISSDNPDNKNKNPKTSLALIGHEPDLGQFISWLLFNQANNCFPLKKGGIAKLNIQKNGQHYLKWILRPKLILGP